MFGYGHRIVPDQRQMHQIGLVLERASLLPIFALARDSHTRWICSGASTGGTHHIVLAPSKNKKEAKEGWMEERSMDRLG